MKRLKMLTSRLIVLLIEPIILENISGNNFVKIDHSNEKKNMIKSYKHSFADDLCFIL